MNIRIFSPVQWVCMCLTVVFAAASPAQDLFPRPVELQPDIDFWVKVYTEVDTSSGFIHDANDVTVIYETLQLADDYHADKKSIKAALVRHSKTLRRLAANPSIELTAEEQRVLLLWGEDADGVRLRKAAGNVRFQRGQSDRFRRGLARS